MYKLDKAAAFLVTAGVLTGAIALSGCSKKSEAEATKNTEIPKTNVVGFKAQQKDLADTIAVIGTLEADEHIEIKSEINGAIDAIHFKEGQEVDEGDVLIQIEKNKLQATLDQAEANLKLAGTTAQRYENLVQSKAVSQQEYDEVAATLASNRAAVDLAREQLKDATIIAPFAGVMGERLVSKGQYIAQGGQLSTLYSQDPMKVAMHVPERYLGDVKIGQTLQMIVAAYKDKTYQGKVYFIDPKIDETTRTALVKAYVDNPEGELKEGMFANVTLTVDIRKDALVIPETALIIKGDDVSVYVVGEDKTARMISVQTGRRSGGMVIIEEGLQQGDVVITEGYQKIGPGSPVNVRFEDITDKKFYEII